MSMKKVVTIYLILLFAGKLMAQGSQPLSASWIEVETAGQGLLEISLYQQFTGVAEPTAAAVSIAEYLWNPAVQNYDSSALRADLVLPLHSSFISVQNLYYPNCDPWIGSQPCSLQRIAVYKVIVSAPPLAVDTAVLRYTSRTAGVMGIQNADLPDTTITAFCYTDFVYLRNQVGPQHTPKIMLSESWHRYFPIYWPANPATGSFINSYLPFTFSTSSPRFVGFDQLWVDFTPANAQLTAADSFGPAHADSNFSFFIRLNDPLQLGIRNVALNQRARWANPLLLWNQVSPGYRHATHVFWVGNVEPALALDVHELDDFGTVLRVQLYDLLGRLCYEGADLSDYAGDRNQFLVLCEFDVQHRMRARKIKLMGY